MSTNSPTPKSRKSLWRKAGGLSRRVCAELALRLALLWVLLRDPSTPRTAKAAIVGAFSYFACPIDAVPDILPLGWIDDAALMGALLTRLSGLITASVRARAWELVPRRFRLEDEAPEAVVASDKNSSPPL